MIPKVGDIVRINPNWMAGYKKATRSSSGHFIDSFEDVDIKIEEVTDKGYETVIMGYSVVRHGSVTLCINPSDGRHNHWLIIPHQVFIKAGGPEEICKETSKAPKNNDGRSTCFWCGAKTRESLGFNSHYDICTGCGK